MFGLQNHLTLNKNNISRLVAGLSVNKIKWIRSLREKKMRDELGLFVVEGEKIVREALDTHSSLIDSVFALEGELEEFQQIQRISYSELERISNLNTPNKALAVLRKPQNTAYEDGLRLVLDTIQDPGNLGTILRLADWFDIKEVICSKETADCFGPKAVQSAMGSVLRVSVRYTDLEEWFELNTLPVYGAVLGGANIYSQPLEENAVLIIGNEGKGISTQLSKHLTHSLTIPKFGHAESLNASVATGIILSEFKRRVFL
jgi:TrmH family RNA methyltransferase